MNRRLAVLAVASLVVLAGCGSLGGVGTTRQPFDVDDPPSESTTTSDVEPAPVIAFNPADDTAPDAFALVDAHYAELDGRAYTVEITSVTRDANDSRLVFDNATRTYGQNRSRYVQYRTSAYRSDVVERGLYANGTHVWERTVRNEANATVRILRDSNGDPVEPRNAIARIPNGELRSGLLAMAVTDVTKLDTVPSGVNDPVFLVTANRTMHQDPFGDRTLNATMTLIVTEEGRIVEYLLERTYVDDGHRVHERTRIQFWNVGTASVTRPDWVPENSTTSNDATASNAVGHLRTVVAASPIPLSMPDRSRSPVVVASVAPVVLASVVRRSF